MRFSLLFSLVPALTCPCWFPLISPDLHISYFPLAHLSFTHLPLDTLSTSSCLSCGQLPCLSPAISPSSLSPSIGQALPCKRSTLPPLSQALPRTLPSCQDRNRAETDNYRLLSLLMAVPTASNPLLEVKSEAQKQHLAVHQLCAAGTTSKSQRFLAIVCLASTRAVCRCWLFQSKRFCLPCCPAQHFVLQYGILSCACCYFKP